MTEQQRNTPVVIISVDEDLDGLRAEAERLTSKVQWITVSPDRFAELMTMLRQRKGHGNEP